MTARAERPDMAGMIRRRGSVHLVALIPYALQLEHDLATARILAAGIARHCRCGAIPDVLGHVAGCRVAGLVELLGGGE